MKQSVQSNPMPHALKPVDVHGRYKFKEDCLAAYLEAG
jgi:hypothetical protein